MYASKDDIDVPQQIGEYESRSREWGDMVVSFERVPAGLDVAPYLEGLPGGKCQCPHWGYLLSGKTVVEFQDHEETIVAGQAYYLPPGHLVRFAEDCETVEFSPKADLHRTAEAVGRNA